MNKQRTSCVESDLYSSSKAFTFLFNREVKHHVHVKREFVPRDQVSPLRVVYCSSFLHIN